MKKHVLAAVVGMCAFASSSAFSASLWQQPFWQNSLPINHEARLKMGVNASFNQYAYAQDGDITVLPQAFYDNNRVYIEGAEAGVYGLKDGTNEWRVSLGYDSRSFDAGEANTEALRELNDRDASVMVGTSYMRITPYGGFKGQIETDVMGNSDGTTVKVAHLSKLKYADDKVTVYPEVGLLWADDKYNKYYYGVDAAESARSGIGQYTPNSSINPYLNISASYDINSHFSAFVSQYLEYMSDEQRNSPLVDSRIDSKTKVGFNYQF